MRQGDQQGGRTGATALDRAVIHQEAGSLIRAVRFRGGGHLTYDDDDRLVLSMGLTADFALDHATGGRRDSVIPQVGRFGLMTPGKRFDIALSGNCHVLQTVLPHDLLAGWLTEDHGVDGARVEIGWGHSVDDPVISRLMCAAKVEGVEGESLALRAVAARLLERHAGSPRRLHRARGGLPLHKLRRVIDRIEDGFSRPASINDLAREVSLSPFHFAHQFSLTTGRSPYRVLIERRLSRAIDLLRDPSLSIADVAALTGFVHGSHLSRQMQRVFGQPPARFRKAIIG